jgi:hypothetical protein
MQEVPAVEAFDIAQFEVSEIGILEVLNPKDEPLLYNGAPVRIHLYGPGSTVYARAQAKADAAAQQRTFAALRGKTNKAAVDEQREDLIVKLVACTARIENFPIPGGADALYRNQKLGYILNQVTKFLDDWGNFQPPSPKN